MKKFRSTEDINFEREQLEFAVDAFLRDRGWKHTCSTPGSYWMWEREVEGRVVTTNKEHALRIQAIIESDDCTCEPNPSCKPADDCPLHGEE